MNLGEFPVRLGVACTVLWGTGGRASTRSTVASSTPWPKESNYLLTRMAVCGVCGGALTVRSRSYGRERRLLYHCLTNVTRGRAICANDMITPLEHAETAVQPAGHFTCQTRAGQITC